MREITIKDIYSGKPDAKDEIEYNVSDEFIRTFVVAEHFNIDSLIHGTNCFITGFKGTGKTALLYYLANLLKQEDESSYSSFILFKDEFTDIKRNELLSISRRILSSISVEPQALVDNSEFEYIWRWLFFKRIVSDNDECSRNLFSDNEYWQKFENLINSIKSPSNTKKSVIPNKIKMAFPIKDETSQTEIAPEIEIDLSNHSDDNYKKFISVIDEAESIFSLLTKTDIPYYIFIDELEAYYGDIDIFKRDLYMIRDLIFTVKRFNSIITRSGYKNIKFICSIRSEIINAISRFIVTKEINKTLTGFSVPLNWNYTNNNSHKHPIIQILLKRIAVCSEDEHKSSLDIYNKWFPEKISGIEPASYILNNSWYKPRDMVRLISTAQNSINNKSKYFSQAVLDSAAKDYSDDSLMEIKEELHALYASKDIDIIISCFTGFKTMFSYSQLKERVTTYFSGTILDTELNQVLNDLYRLGFLGNYLPAGRTYHWQHRGDGMLILTDEWRIFIHYALHRALSLGSRNDRGLNKGQLPQIGDRTIAIVEKTFQKFVVVSFHLYGQKYEGSIHVSEFRKLGYSYIDNLSVIIKQDEKYDVVIKEYNEQHNNWRLCIVNTDSQYDD